MSEPNPRKLTLHQQAVLIQVLLTFPDQHVDVRYNPDSSDALGYARDFLTIFKVIGWKVSDDAPSGTFIAQFTGVSIIVREHSSIPASAEALRDALRIYAVEATMLYATASTMMSGGFVLAVGPRA